MIDLDTLLADLHTLRLTHAGQEEAAIRDRIAAHLLARGIPVQTEHVFAPGCRADLWIDGIVLEVKIRRPPRGKAVAQLSRYARQDAVRAVVLVLEEAMPGLPSLLAGKPCRVVSLHACWGVAV